MSDNIKVGIRLKPMIHNEKDENLSTEWIVRGNSIVCSDPEAVKRGNTEFHFDYVFDSDATSHNVFDSIVKPIVNATLNGINGTVFCYGQHRSGKTYTMIGNKEEPGIIQICIKYIFNTISNTIGREFLLRVSYLEISNEAVNDLLNVNGIDLKLHEDANECTTVNCKEEVSESSDDMLSILKRGNRNTCKEEINRNQWRRDHKIFRITIESREIGDTSGKVQVSQLNLVDLAGFERAHKIDDAQEQQIDVSLLAFESTIVQLDELQNVQRDISLPKSKLTQLLQPSLSGNCLIAIIFTVVPISLEETYFSLSFACQAKKIKNKPKKNEVTSDTSLLSIKNGNPSIDVDNEDSKLREEYQNNRLVEDQIRLLQKQIISGSTSDRSEPYKCRTRRRQSGCNSGTFKSHLPVYQNKSGLPTIKEISPEKPHGKGNMHSVDVQNQTLRTALADFELDLIEWKLDSESKENAGSLEEEDVDVTDNLTVGEFEDIDGRVTPDRQDSSVQTIFRNSTLESPSTPKKILRKYIFDLTKDLVELREFTTLEKQILREEGHPGINNVDDQLLKQSDLIRHKEEELHLHSSSLIVQLEEEKVELTEKLELKIQELEEIKSDVQGLKADIEKLQQTILLLTNENMEMSTKLNAEKERMNEAELNIRKTIDGLHARISQVMEEKINLECNLAVLKNQLQSLRSQMSEPRNDEQLPVNYQIKIDTLVSENIDLSATLAEKNEELEKIKESKPLLYDHECLYKDQLAALTKRNEGLMIENNNLSTDLMDKIEENEMLQKECDVLKNKIIITEQANATDNDVEHLRSENHILKTEVLELKMKVTMLSEENAKFSNNLFETIQDLDNSRSEKFTSSSPHSSGTFEEVSSEESREALFEKIAMLQEKISELTSLNKKLSDLKLTTCSQCAHLRNLNDSRISLKIEKKILNRKVEELQKQFDQKCLDIEALKSKVNQDLNLSFADTSLNTSFADGLNVSFIEKKVDHLNNELQTMKDDNDKLIVLYQEKCDELEKLHDEVGDSKDIKPKKNIVKDESRIQKIQISIDQVRDDIDELKKNSVNFTSMLNKFRTEKASLLKEINTLRSINEQLQQRVSDTEISAATATEKAHVLEAELLNMNKEIEQYSEKEKEIESGKLKLEMELENKDIVINRLHKTIDDLNECVSSLKNELDSMLTQKNELAVVKETIEQKYSNELNLLQEEYQKIDAEKKQCSDAEKRATLWAKALETDVEKLQTDLGKQESLYKEVQEKVSQLETLLEESELEKEVLKQNLQALEKLVTDSKDNLAIKYKTEFEIIEKKFEQYTKESEIKLQKINETLSKYVDENDNLTQELTKLRAIELKFQEMKENEYMFLEEKALANDDKKVKGELSTVKESMIKELKALKHKLNSVDLLSKTANEIFIIFLQTVMTKEEEMIKTMKELFEQDKQKLEDEKRQSADAEKRATSWADELERETEKLQMDLTKRESTHKQQQDKIYELERVLEENNLEKETLKEKVETLKVELNNLQTEFDKQCKVDCRREEAIMIAQKKEKEMQEEHNKRETKLEQKLKSQKETYEKRIEDLVHTIESYKTKNLDLKSNIEGLEANEKQLKNIIDANALELKANDQTINKLGIELEQLTEAHKEVNCEVQQTTFRIEEISALLKNKCDLISEYKAKLEATLPDYELLKDQVKERKASIERYKEQMGELKMEKEKQIEMIKDKLNSEQIKNVGLNKQLHELNNKNIALVEELDALKGKFEELQSANTKLERKIRNSTSKVKAEAEMENLKDLNKRLQNNLDGASNRIIELQDSKNKILKELVDLTGQYELLSQENAEITITLSSYKSRQSSPCFLLGDGKYDTLLQEKNKTALELESKKLLLNQRDIEIKEHLSRVKELSVKNKELDELLRDRAGVIHEREKEIAKLKDKLYLHRIENKLIRELEEKLTNLREENEQLQKNLESFKSRPQIDTRQMDDVKLHNEKVVNSLRREITDLQEKVNEYEDRLDQKSSSSGSRCVSPAFGISRRRQSRNKIFNEKRQLENLSDEINIDKSDETCQTCQILRKRIQELDLQIVLKNGHIATLELQIQSENFPYHQKCKELEERLLSYRNKNVDLGCEIRKLQRTLSDVNALECETCRKWRFNRRNQSCQTVPEIPSGVLTPNNGIVNDCAKVTKLEKEKTLMKDLCRVRNRRIKELEDKLQQLSHKSPEFDTENDMISTVTTVPANLLDLRMPVNYRRNIWNDY
ncbi:uncharacterized protein LOC143208341 isoform X2 [Lasioglossum baleicum]|uniref:uncharacterized protein LOC143208341 isoform X2 n=1 Tax=Lasioglossum baleicum TaxID=434251 RepID=UPI003FCD21DA